MKKMILGLCALVACFVFASCSNYADKAKDLAGEFEKAEKAEDFVKIMKDAAQLNLDFYKSNPSAEDVEAFEEAGKAIKEAANKLDGDKKKAYEEAQTQLLKDEEFVKITKDALEAEKEWQDKNKKEGEKEDKE